MNYDIAFRFQAALDPSALTTFTSALHGVTAAIDDCRKAGKASDSDPAVLLLIRHLGHLAVNIEVGDSALRHACLEAIGDMRRRPVLATLARRGVAYDDNAKKLFHSEARRGLRNLADSLGYARTDYDLHSNLAGPAVSGEVTLHSDEIHVQASCDSGGLGIRYRRCRGRRDQIGERNYFADLRELTNPGALAQRICRDLQLPTPAFDDRLVA